MTFYNPNIQFAFDEDKTNFIVLKNSILATYTLVYKILDPNLINTLPNVNTCYQLQFVRFENEIQQQKLNLISPDFADLIAEIALEVQLKRVVNFNDFINLKLSLTTESELNTILYMADYIQDFIELLVYSDFASPIEPNFVRDFTKLLGIASSNTNIPVFYGLYDRLKLYAKLKYELNLETEIKGVNIDNRELSLSFRIRI